MKAAQEVEKYMMIVDIISSLGIPFEEAVNMENYEIYQLYNELKESRIPNHLGFSR